MEEQGVNVDEMLKKQEMTNAQIADLYEMTKKSTGVIAVIAVVGAIGVSALLLGASSHLAQKNKQMEKLEFLKEHEFEIEKKAEAFLNNRTEVKKLVQMYVTEKQTRGFIEQTVKTFGKNEKEMIGKAMQAAVLGQKKLAHKNKNEDTQDGIERYVIASIKYRDGIQANIAEEVEWYLSKEGKTRVLVQDYISAKLLEEGFHGTDDKMQAIIKQLNLR